MCVDRQRSLTQGENRQAGSRVCGAALCDRSKNRQAGEQAGEPAGRPAGGHADGQAGGQAGGQVGGHAGGHADGQAGGQAVADVPHKPTNRTVAALQHAGTQCQWPQV